MIRLRQFSLLLVLSAAAAAAAEPSKAPAPAYPERVAYRGYVLDAAGAPLAGRFDVALAYFAGADELLRETQRSVEVRDGRFRLELGVGALEPGPSARGVGTFAALFASHPEVQMQVTLGGVRQSPRITILPAGHSPESRAVLAGLAKPDDGKPHAKAYRAPAGATAVQAAVLRPASGESSAQAGGGGGRGPHGPFELPMIGPFRSRPLRELPAVGPRDRVDYVEPQEIKQRHEDLFDAAGHRYGTRTEKVVDRLAAASQLLAPTSTPAPIDEFEGISNLGGFIPPDTHGAAGPDHYVQVVNVHYQVFNKDGTSAGGPFETNVLWDGFGGGCENNNNGDAIFLYDWYAERWVLTQFSISGSPDGVCIAVSETSDPLGSYNLYQLVTQRFPDYFKLGVWPDSSNNAYFMGTNTGFQGQYDVYALDRESMLAGDPASPAQFFQNYLNLMMPADANGATLPPGGSNGLFYTFRDGGEEYFDTPDEDNLDVWEFHVDWTTPGNSTFINTQSFEPPDFAEFNWTVCGFFEENCLPQPDTSQGIDSGSWWPMQRLVYRNFGDHETLLGSWTVDVTGSPNHAAPRWFELRRSGASWSVFQQGTQAPDAAHRWEPSIAMDGAGNIALGYSVIDAANDLYASIRYALRSPVDTPGTLQNEATIFIGTGAQTSSAARWGDYSSMTVDPADDCSFWYTNQYFETTSSGSWKTRIAHVAMPGCGGIRVAPDRLEICATTDPDFAVTLLGQFTATTDLTADGCPPGASCDFTVNPVVSPDEESTLEITGLGSAPSGLYPIDVVATEDGNPSNTNQFPIELLLAAQAPSVVPLVTPANGALAQVLRPSFDWDTDADATSYELEVATDPSFASPLFTATVTSTDHLPTSDLPSNATIYWRVRPSNLCGTADFSEIFWFETESASGDCPEGKAAEIAYSYGFESGANGWTSSGTGDSWAQSATAYSGSFSWHANNDTADSDQQLVSPSVVLPSGQTPLTLSFFNQQAIEPDFDGAVGCYDGGILEISTNGGGSYTQVTAGLLTDAYDGKIGNGSSNPLHGKFAWCDAAQPWLNSIVDLAPYAGQTVKFRFRMGTDPFTGLEGWFLDDVVVKSCVDDPTIFDDGLEIGTTSRWSDTVP